VSSTYVQKSAAHTDHDLPVPFVITMVGSLLVASYMLFDPTKWLYDLMQLTYLSKSFKVFILVLALGGFVVAYVAEQYFLPQLARFIGMVNHRLRPKHGKKRKQYKLIQESMHF